MVRQRTVASQHFSHAADGPANCMATAQGVLVGSALRTVMVLCSLALVCCDGGPPVYSDSGMPARFLFQERNISVPHDTSLSYSLSSEQEAVVCSVGVTDLPNYASHAVVLSAELFDWRAIDSAFRSDTRTFGCGLAPREYDVTSAPCDGLPYYTVDYLAPDGFAYECSTYDESVPIEVKKIKWYLDSIAWPIVLN